MYHKQARIRLFSGVAGVAAVVIACFFYLGLDAWGLATAPFTFVRYAAANFFPPAWGNLGVYARAVLQTVAFAAVSTMISAVLSVLFALLMAEAVMPWRGVRGLARLCMTFVRNIPVLIWASILVMIFGIGSMVGLVALVLATTGFLSRSYAESINEIAARKLEGMRAAGVGTLGMIRHGLLPEFAPAFLNWTLFSFELGVRASAVLGMVGAGGMGTLLQTQLSLRRFHEVATLVLLLIGVVLAIEFAANWLRKKVLHGGGAAVAPMAKPRVRPLCATVRRWLAAGGLAVLFFAALHYISLDVARFVGRFARVPLILRAMAGVNTDMLLPGVRQFGVSFAMGVVGLALGGLLALVLAFLAAENIAPSRAVAALIKGFISLIRAVPTLIFILMIVAAIGLGYTAGVVGLVLSSVGYLTKAFIATIEEQPRGLITALRATGANWGQIVLHGLLPAVATGFLAWVAIRLETSVAESVTLGVVGAGGIGTLLAQAIRRFDYPGVTVLIAIIVLGMIALEWLAGRVRRAIARV